MRRLCCSRSLAGASAALGKARVRSGAARGGVGGLRERGEVARLRAVVGGCRLCGRRGELGLLRLRGGGVGGGTGGDRGLLRRSGGGARGQRVGRLELAQLALDVALELDAVLPL